MLRVLDQVNDPGKGRDSEDRLGCRPAEGIAWILDGCTDVCAARLFPEAPSDAFWFAGEAHALLAALHGDASTVVDGLVEKLRARVEDRIAAPVETIPPGDMPSAALTWMHIDPDSQQLTFAGYPDCTAIVLPAGGPAFPVDTHIHRLMTRWKLTSGKSVEQTERDAKKIFPKELWNKLHLQIIFYGREYSPARGWSLDKDFLTKTLLQGSKA